MSTRLFVIIRVISPSPKIVKLLTFKAENLVVHDHADMDAFAVQYIAVHDRRPIEVPPAKRLRLLAGESETNRYSGYFPFAFSLDHFNGSPIL